ncbi:MAG: AAA family ATPase, partial [Rhodobacteraceae bacterium]|nr:AAA family ATPase [Paracoccaceae bacterium]
MHKIKKAAITREGFEYQDCLGMQFLIDMYIDPSLYEWVKLDAEDPQFRHVEDIVAKRKVDGKFVCRQVKFRVEPDRKDLALSFDWLTKKSGKTDQSKSLLQKCAEQVLPMLEKDEVYDAKLLTNAIPDHDVLKSLNDEGFIEFEQIPATYLSKIISQLNGENQARKFFEFFQFEHSQTPNRVELASQLRNRLIPNYTDESGWLTLQLEVKNWAILKDSPNQGGCIRLENVSRILSKERPRPIPQNFYLPNKYLPPNEDFHKHIIQVVQDTGIIVVTGSPGRGKSTYISYLCNVLRKNGYPLIRHHYFLSLEDQTSERYTYHTVASSLQHQMKRQHAEAVKGLDEKTDKLKECIEACSRETKENPFVIVIDGLDHVWRENYEIDQMQILFNRLLPLPKNVTLIIGTQDVPKKQLPPKLLKFMPKKNWKTLPLMSVPSIRHWLNIQADGGSLGKLPEDNNQRKNYLNSLSKAFHNKSDGHPLHLVYSFESIIAKSQEISVNTINTLPECPEGDIRQYYEGLWVSLTPEAKEYLHLFAATEFSWPENGLLECLEYISDKLSAFNSIKHLLDRRSSGLVPFHGSILVFIQSKSNHPEAASRLLPRAINWLESSANEYWRWAWLWLTQAKIGIEAPILTKPTREWAIYSLCCGYPIEQMVSILDVAERVALKKKEYCRLQELIQLKFRLMNCTEFQTDIFDMFQHSVSYFTDDPTPFEWMADNLPLIRDEDLITVARRFKEEKQEVPENC